MVESSVKLHTDLTNYSSRHWCARTDSELQTTRLRVVSQFKSELLEGQNQSNLLAFHPDVDTCSAKGTKSRTQRELSAVATTQRSCCRSSGPPGAS